MAVGSSLHLSVISIFGAVCDIASWLLGTTHTIAVGLLAHLWFGIMA
jgi:hypothetical protein